MVRGQACRRTRRQPACGRASAHTTTRRTAWLESQGYRVMRFWNNDVLKAPRSVGEAVYAAASERAARQEPHPRPLPTRGRGAHCGSGEETFYDDNGKNEPLGYGHDHKGAALGDAKNEGRPTVTHQPADRDDGPKTIKFTLDGQEVEAPEGETIFRTARRYGINLPHLCYSPKPGYRPDGNCRVCMVEIEGERVLAASCIRKPTDGMKVKTQTDRAKTARRMVVELLMADQPARDVARDPEFGILEDRDAPEGRDQPLRAARRGARARPQPSRHGGQSRRLHPVQSVRPRLPRSAGQRRDRHGGPRPPREDRVRLRRPDGRVDLRRLRRVRAGLPDRRPDAVHPGERQQRAHRGAFPRPLGRQRVPLLRRRLPAHLSHQGRQAALRHRQERPGEREPPVREGPLRLRLRAQSAAPHPADDPEGRRAEGAARVHRSDEPVDAFPPRHLGRGARPRGLRPEAPARHATARSRSPASARPSAPTRKPTCSRSWCAPASAPTMSITARGSAMPRRSRRCSKASARPRCRRPSTR